MDKWIEEMHEASKLDHTVIVGSDIRQLTGEIARLTAALEEAKRERDSLDTQLRLLIASLPDALPRPDAEPVATTTEKESTDE
jgi:outer membrane protein TolC